QAATVASTYALQTFGLPAVAEGNVISLSNVQLGIVEACSGLSMLLVFLAVCTAVAIVIRRPMWERIVILGSALPIALIANEARITTTGVLHETVGHFLANKVFHDWGSWLMMVLALGLLWLEIVVLSRLFVEDEAGKYQSAIIPGASSLSGARAPARKASHRVPSKAGKPRSLIGRSGRR